MSYDEGKEKPNILPLLGLFHFIKWYQEAVSGSPHQHKGTVSTTCTIRSKAVLSDQRQYNVSVHQHSSTHTQQYFRSITCCCADVWLCRCWYATYNIHVVSGDMLIKNFRGLLDLCFSHINIQLQCIHWVIERVLNKSWQQPWVPMPNVKHWCQTRTLTTTYRKTSNISHTLICNKIVDNSDVVGASPVGAAPTTSSFSI